MRLQPVDRVHRFLVDVYTHTPIVKMLILMVVMWLASAAFLYWAEQDVAGSRILSYTDALYWGVAAFSTAGIADTPVADLSKLIGGLWIVIGSSLFFGTIVASITTYFMRPLRRPVRQIVDTIEYNLEQLDELSVEELEMLKRTADSLIVSMERIKKAQLEVGD